MAYAPGAKKSPNENSFYERSIMRVLYTLCTLQATNYEVRSALDPLYSEYPYIR